MGQASIDINYAGDSTPNAVDAPAFTKGPWRLADDLDEDFVAAAILGPDGDLIADCNIFGNPGRPEAECMANAELIVSAVNAKLSVPQTATQPDAEVNGELADACRLAKVELSYLFEQTRSREGGSVWRAWKACESALASVSVSA